jgi:hypothetical protein
MTNEKINLKKYDLHYLTTFEKSNTNGGFWWLVWSVAAAKYVYEWNYDNSIKQGYNDAINFLLNDEQKNKIIQ